MRILKKSLACLLVAIMAATAMFGCLVSADTINGTISVWGTTVHPDAESFDVYVDVAAESAISVARVKVNVPVALGTITSATVEGEGVKAFDTEVPDEDYDLANGIFLVEGSDWSVGYTAATITLTITPAADVAAGTYAVTAENITDVEGADWSENPCTFAITNADVIVPYALTLDGDNLAVTLAAGETATVMGTIGGAVGVVEATGDYSIGYGFMPVNGDFIMTMFGGGNTFTVTNNADAEITVTLEHYTLPTKGTMDDPEIITENGNYVANVGLNHVDQGYYYQYTATEAGTVNIEMNSATWFYVVNNMTTYAYGDNVYSDDGSATYSVDVAANDIIQIIVNTNTYAVGTVDWDFAFEAAVEPEYEAKDFVAPITITYGVANQAITSALAYTADGGKALADYVNSIGGKVTSAGWKLTVDGTDPTTLETAVCTNENAPATIMTSTGVSYDRLVTDTRWEGFLAGTKTFSLQNVSYSGMNLDQIANNYVKVVAYYIYTDAEGVSQTVYGDVESYNLMDHLETLTEDANAQAIVNAYALKEAATAANVAGDASSKECFATVTPSYNLKNASVVVALSYSATEGKALADYVNSIGGKVTSAGWKLTVDGTDPTTLETAVCTDENAPATIMTANGVSYDRLVTDTRWEGFLAGTNTFSLQNISYSGMNIAQFSSNVKVVPYYIYTDAEGVSQTVYGDVLTYVFADMIAEDDSELAVAYKNLIDLF